VGGGGGWGVCGGWGGGGVGWGVGGGGRGGGWGGGGGRGGGGGVGGGGLEAYGWGRRSEVCNRLIPACTSDSLGGPGRGSSQRVRLPPPSAPVRRGGSSTAAVTGSRQPCGEGHSSGPRAKTPCGGRNRIVGEQHRTPRRCWTRSNGLGAARGCAGQLVAGRRGGGRVQARDALRTPLGRGPGCRARHDGCGPTNEIGQPYSRCPPWAHFGRGGRRGPDGHTDACKAVGQCGWTSPRPGWRDVGGRAQARWPGLRAG